MNTSDTGNAIGFVPSLEALPFLQWASSQGLRTKACPGYGTVHRRLLTGELDGGLVPWELAIADLVLMPGQQSAWRIPVVLKACPMELVLSHAAMKKVYPHRRRRAVAEPVSLKFGIEARHSFTRNQILAWQAHLDLGHLQPPTFKVLPMNLMLAGLAKGEIDGVLAPVPWGMQAENEGHGRIDREFTRGEFAQHLVLVCRESLMERRGPQLANAARDLRKLKGLLSPSYGLEEIAGRMGQMGPPHLDPAIIREAACRYPLDALADEFTPDEKWFDRELGVLARRHGIEIRRNLAADLGHRRKGNADPSP